MRRALAACAVGLWVAAPASTSGARSEETPPEVDAGPPVTDAIPLGPSVESRLAEIQRRVQQVVAYPPLARGRRLEGETLVEFEIDAAGAPRDVRTVRSSGSLTLDAAAEAAVHDAAPLPYVFGRVAVPVEFSLDDQPDRN